MRKFHRYLPWAILTPFLPTGLATPVADSTGYGYSIATNSGSACAASPTEYTDLPVEFWLETIFLKPLSGPDVKRFGLRPDNPVRDAGNLYTKVTVASELDARDLFYLDAGDLRNTKTKRAFIIPPTTKQKNYRGWYSLAFDVDEQEGAVQLYFWAVKSCNAAGDIELQLRARRSDNSSERTVFLSCPSSLR